MKKVLTSIIVVTFTMLLTLSIGVNVVNAQGSLLDQGKALMEKSKATNQDETAVTPPAAGADQSSGQAATTEGQGTLMDKGKALMDQGGMMDKAKGLMNQGK